MKTKKIESVIKVYNSLVTLLHNILIEESIDKEQVFYSLFGIIVLELIITKEDVIKLKEGITYESVMSDDMLDNLLVYLNIENIDKSLNGATVYSILRNKLAHGDYYLDGEYLVFNVNDKECKVLLKQFVYYYVHLTNRLNCRLKTKKFKKERLNDSALNKFDKILVTDEDIKEFLNLLSYKNFTLKRLDNKELTTHEKIFFEDYIYKLYQANRNDDKLCDKLLKESINSDIYDVKIITKKITEFDNKYDEIKKIINKFNEIYNNDVKYSEHVIFKSAEDIYKITTSDYEHESIKYGIKTIKTILYKMIDNNIYDFDEFIDKMNLVDPYYIVSIPINEVVISIVLSLIYFNFCYPLEKLYKANKIYNTDINDFDFNNLDLSELSPEVNKLYEIGIKNVINEATNRVNALEKENEKYLKKISKREEQRDNLITKRDSSLDKEKIDKVISNLDTSINLLKISYQNNNNLYLAEEIKLNNLLKIFKDTNMNFYNYSIINGIRNAIAHGNISLKNVTGANLKDIEVEFLDIYDNDIQFKLNVKLYNLFSLIEVVNTKPTGDFLIQKKLKNIK